MRCADPAALRSRTGIVYTVTPRAVGVIVYKIVGNRYMEKRVNLRIEHVRHSKCRDDFLNRVKANAAAKKDAKARGEHVVLKRLPAAPRESRTVSTSGNQPQTLQPQPYGPSSCRCPPPPHADFVLRRHHHLSSRSSWMAMSIAAFAVVCLQWRIPPFWPCSSAIFWLDTPTTTTPTGETGDCERSCVLMRIG